MCLVNDELIDNGGLIQHWHTYKCDKCGKILPENHPRESFSEANTDYCGDCAYLNGIINEQEYIKYYCFWIDIPNLRAVIHNGEIHLGVGKFEWERTSRVRESKAYREWRDSIYQRDNYICQKCGARGGNLNAHHIKSYAKYPDLRLEISNGITLCEQCHKELHKQLRRK